MKACSSCRFFGAEFGIEAWDEDDDDYIETNHHSCARIIHGNDGKQFHKVKDELAVVTDGSGYSARLRVLPTFGCVLHEERE